MQLVAGNKPSRPFLPPIQGVSKRADEKLLWKGSSHSGFRLFIETHLKQSMEETKKDLFKVSDHLNMDNRIYLYQSQRLKKRL